MSHAKKDPAGTAVIPVGEIIRVQYDFVDENGVAVDPSTVRVHYLDAAGVKTTIVAPTQIDNPAVGSYVFEEPTVDATDLGDHTVVFDDGANGEHASPRFIVTVYSTIRLTADG